MLENDGPQGRTYTYEGNEYQFEPVLLTARGQKLVKRKLQLKHEKICESLLRLASMPGCSQEVRKELLDQMYSGFRPGLAEVVGAIGDVEMLPTVLTVVCPELRDPAQAVAFVEQHDNVTALSGVLVRSCGLEEIKNLNRLIREQVEEKDQADPDQQSQSTNSSPVPMAGAPTT